MIADDVGQHFVVVDETSIWYEGKNKLFPD